MCWLILLKKVWGSLGEFHMGGVGASRGPKFSLIRPLHILNFDLFKLDNLFEAISKCNDD